MNFKPRIVITIAEKTSRSEVSIVEGRIMTNGLPSPAPTKKQFEIAYKAVRDLLGIRSSKGRRP